MKQDMDVFERTCRQREHDLKISQSRHAEFPSLTELHKRTPSNETAQREEMKSHMKQNGEDLSKAIGKLVVQLLDPKEKSWKEPQKSTTAVANPAQEATRLAELQVQCKKLADLVHSNAAKQDELTQTVTARPAQDQKVAELQLQYKQLAEIVRSSVAKHDDVAQTLAAKQNEFAQTLDVINPAQDAKVTELQLQYTQLAEHVSSSAAKQNDTIQALAAKQNELLHTFSMTNPAQDAKVAELLLLYKELAERVDSDAQDQKLGELQLQYKALAELISSSAAKHDEIAQALTVKQNEFGRTLVATDLAQDAKMTKLQLLYDRLAEDLGASTAKQDELAELFDRALAVVQSGNSAEVSRVDELQLQCRDLADRLNSSAVKQDEFSQALAVATAARDEKDAEVNSLSKQVSEYVSWTVAQQNEFAQKSLAQDAKIREVQFQTESVFERVNTALPKWSEYFKSVGVLNSKLEEKMAGVQNQQGQLVQWLRTAAAKQDDLTRAFTAEQGRLAVVEKQARDQAALTDEVSALRRENAALKAESTSNKSAMDRLLQKLEGLSDVVNEQGTKLRELCASSDHDKSGKRSHQERSLFELNANTIDNVAIERRLEDHDAEIKEQTKQIRAVKQAQNDTYFFCGGRLDESKDEVARLMERIKKLEAKQTRPKQVINIDSDVREVCGILSRDLQQAAEGIKKGLGMKCGTPVCVIASLHAEFGTTSTADLLDRAADRTEFAFSNPAPTRSDLAKLAFWMEICSRQAHTAGKGFRQARRMLELMACGPDEAAAAEAAAAASASAGPGAERAAKKRKVLHSTISELPAEKGKTV